MYMAQDRTDIRYAMKGAVERNVCAQRGKLEGVEEVGQIP